MPIVQDEAHFLGESMNLKNKYIILLIVLIITGCTVSIIGYLRITHQRDMAIEVLEQELTESVKTKLVNATEILLSEIMKEFPVERAAQISYLQALTNGVFYDQNRSGYFFVYDYDCITTSNPPNPSANGTSRKTLKDSEGVFLIQELANAAKRGGGFVSYRYPKPGSAEPQPKISYAAPISDSDFFIGTWCLRG